MVTFHLPAISQKQQFHIMRCTVHGRPIPVHHERICVVKNAASDSLQQEFYKNHHIKPSHVVYHGVDIDLLGNQNTVKDIDVIGVGSFSIIKQYDLFVEIIAELKNYFPSIKAMLCSDGEDRERLRR